MTQEDKNLILKDLCARVPYGVKAKANDISVVTINGVVKRQSLTGYFDYDIITNNGNFYLKEVKPYLRPLSSMTEEEKEQMRDLWIVADGKTHATRLIDFYNKNNFDFRGLIPAGLAIEVTDDNNPYGD